MTSTTGSDAAGYGAVCRCGWVTSSLWDTRNAVRAAGDAHLAEANAS